MAAAEIAMSQVDGCPECVRNVEAPRSAVVVEGGWRTAYLCTDCGHAWTTDWAAKALVPSGVWPPARERIGAQVKTPRQVRQTPVVPGLTDYEGVG